MEFTRKGDKNKYSFLDKLCIGRSCWNPGMFQHRGATLSGSRNTGGTSATCMTRAYHGCPDLIPEPSKELIKIRVNQGWRK